MTTPPTLVLLPGTSAPAALTTTLVAGLGGAAEVLLAPPPQASRAFSLTAAAGAVADQLDRAGAGQVTLVGFGVGAMVALQLAADQPQRVGGLVLLTRQVAVSPVLLSLPAAVLRLLPAATVHRIGARPEQVLGLLDQVRPPDFGPLATRVTAPAVVVCGARDRLNRRASTQLARALPAGEVRLVPGARQGWLERQPELLLEVVRALRGRS
jgi:pimeloyl-ACP methyl ester carboxylesterase